MQSEIYTTPARGRTPAPALSPNDRRRSLSIDEVERRIGESEARLIARRGELLGRSSGGARALGSEEGREAFRVQMLDGLFALRYALTRFDESWLRARTRNPGLRRMLAAADEFHRALVRPPALLVTVGLSGLVHLFGSALKSAARRALARRESPAAALAATRSEREGLAALLASDPPAVRLDPRTSTPGSQEADWLEGFTEGWRLEAERLRPLLGPVVAPDERARQDALRGACARALERSGREVEPTRLRDRKLARLTRALLALDLLAEARRRQVEDDVAQLSYRGDLDALVEWAETRNGGTPLNARSRARILERACRQREDLRYDNPEYVFEEPIEQLVKHPVWRAEFEALVRPAGSR